MKTIDNTPTYIPLISNIRTPMSQNEKIQKEKNFYFYYDNANICQYYGQANIEKCIFLLFFNYLYLNNTLLLYKYYEKIFILFYYYNIIN